MHPTLVRPHVYSCYRSSLHGSTMFENSFSAASGLHKGRYLRVRLRLTAFAVENAQLSPNCTGSAPLAQFQPRLHRFSPACTGSAPLAQVQPQLHRFSPACTGSAPLALVQPRLHRFIVTLDTDQLPFLLPAQPRSSAWGDHLISHHQEPPLPHEPHVF
eukprot:3568210-Rhodomonas_salina.3